MWLRFIERAKCISSTQHWRVAVAVGGVQAGNYSSASLHPRRHFPLFPPPPPLRLRRRSQPRRRRPEITQPQTFPILLRTHTAISHFTISFNMRSRASAIANRGSSTDNDGAADGVGDGNDPPSSSASLPCHECGQTFRRREHLNRHLDRHSGRRSHTCSICKRPFSRRCAFSVPCTACVHYISRDTCD